MRALVFSRRLRRPPRTSSTFLPAPHQMGSLMPEAAPPCRRSPHGDSGRRPPLSVYGYPVTRPDGLSALFRHDGPHRLAIERIRIEIVSIFNVELL